MAETASRFSSHERTAQIRKIRASALEKLSVIRRRKELLKQKSQTRWMETLRATGYAGSFGLLLLGAFMNDHIDMKVISAGVVLEAAFLGNILDATSGHYLERTGFLTKAKKIHRNTNKKVQRLNERFDRANLPTKA